jgi:hypothetical protein
MLYCWLCVLSVWWVWCCNVSSYYRSGALGTSGSAVLLFAACRFKCTFRALRIWQISGSHGATSRKALIFSSNLFPVLRDITGLYCTWHGKNVSYLVHSPYTVTSTCAVKVMLMCFIWNTNSLSSIIFWGNERSQIGPVWRFNLCSRRN